MLLLVRRQPIESFIWMGLGIGALVYDVRQILLAMNPPKVAPETTAAKQDDNVLYIMDDSQTHARGRHARLQSAGAVELQAAAELRLEHPIRQARRRFVVVVPQVGQRPADAAAGGAQIVAAGFELQPQVALRRRGWSRSRQSSRLSTQALT